MAVITQGAKWQFKEWPHKGAPEGDLSDLFSRVCGFFLHFINDKVPEVVSSWNVKKLGLHKENRHQDMAVMLEIFRHLDSWLTAHKSPYALS